MGDVLSSIKINSNFDWNSTTNTITQLNDVNWSTLGFSNSNYINLLTGYTFDGNNKTIDISGITTSGLFISGGSDITIKNLGVINGSTATGGGLIMRGSQDNFIIENCYSTGTISGTNDSGTGSGGIVGSSAAGSLNSSAIIRNCYSTGAITGRDCGGIVADYAGERGVCTILNCYSKGTISGQEAGGICGGFAGGNGTDGSVIITNCYTTGTITYTATDGGGICGKNEGTPGTVTITNCYSSRTNSSDVYNSSDIFSTNSSFDFIDGFSLSSLLFGTIATLPSSTFYSIANGYPIIKRQVNLYNKPDGTFLQLFDPNDIYDESVQYQMIKYNCHFKNIRDKLSRGGGSFGPARVTWNCPYKGGVIKPSWELGLDPILNRSTFDQQLKNAKKYAAQNHMLRPK